MEKAVEEHIRVLAQPLWESAARPYGMAMDFWLMAEQMVLEMMAATARMQDKAISPPPLPRTGELPSAVPVAKVRALAECMWDFSRTAVWNSPGLLARGRAPRVDDDAGG